MIFAFIAMGLVALAGVADLAVEALEEGADDIEERFDELRGDPRVQDLLGLDDVFNDTDARNVVGGEGEDEILQGRAGNDNIIGNYGDADTLDGGFGDDRLTMLANNVSNGGPGTDIFQLYPDSNGVITDFRPGVDNLRLDANLDLLNQDGVPALDWRVTEDGVELHFVAEGEVPLTSDSFVVLLEGLEVPPPTESITFSVIDDGQDDVFEFTGEDINFAQTMIGTEGNDTFSLSDEYTTYEVRPGAGDDTVVFDSMRAQTFLADGDDTYQSLATPVFGNPELDAAETVYGGTGNDTIQGPETAFEAWGGAGDDVLQAVRVDNDAGDVAMLNGGLGDDTITFGENTEATGGAGQDSFTFFPVIGDQLSLSSVTDFDPEEDALVIQLDTLYEGPGVATLALSADEESSILQIDGQPTLLLSQTVSDLSSIVVFR